MDLCGARHKISMEIIIPICMCPFKRERERSIAVNSIVPVFIKTFKMSFFNARNLFQILRGDTVIFFWHFFFGFYPTPSSFLSLPFLLPSLARVV
jgi:hypothetical protein